MAAFIYLITLLLTLSTVLSFDNIVDKFLLIPHSIETGDINRWLNDLQHDNFVDWEWDRLGFPYNTRKVRRLSPDERKKYIETFAKNIRGNSPKQVLDFIGLVEEHDGYVAEEHWFQNDDEYNLTLHRISGSPRSPKKDGKPVIFIQHGLLLSSDAYVLNGPEKDLAFLLADLGYDVWFGNARGNTYSRSHTSYSADDAEFWNFTFHEVGVTDLPNSIDYVLAETNNPSLALVGYSIGATESYLMLSEKPYYNEKINLLVGISPLGFWHPIFPDRCRPNDKDHCKSMLSTLQGHYQKLEYNARLFHDNEVYPQTFFMQYFAHSMCREVKICNAAIESFFGEKPTTAFDSDSIIKLFSHVPAGTSAKTILHLYQNINSGEFARYDPLIRFEDLPRKIPDAEPYDLSSIKVPVVVFKTDKEEFYQTKDENALKRQIPNLVTYKIKVPGSDKPARMLDFPLSPHAKLINKSIAGVLKQTLISFGQYS